MNTEQLKKLEKKAASRGISQENGYERHVLFCGQSGCCKDHNEAKAALKVLNKGAKKLKEDGVKVYVTEVECLKLCQNGPIAVVYPDGVWYGRVTPEICARIVEEHLGAGEVVEDAVFARNRLEE